jgi:PAS domain S-box-containing protein
MFGYGRRELVGKDVSILVPPPLAQAHESYMKAYIASGHGVRGSVRRIGTIVHLCTLIIVLLCCY